jgi:RNA polymerase sigma-70 factor (ECF subfamily)
MNERPPVQLGDKVLVDLARNGDRSAFEELVERYKHKTYHIAFGFTRDREEAKDLSQEAFLKAFLNIESFDGRSTFYTWFYRLLINVCLDYKRRLRRPTEEFNEAAKDQSDPGHAPAITAAPDTHAMARQLSRKIGAALEDLPPKQRTAFILKNHQGLSIKEIAEVMQTAEGTVKVHLHRAVAALREKLAGFAQEGR